MCENTMIHGTFELMKFHQVKSSMNHCVLHTCIFSAVIFDVLSLLYWHAACKM